MQVDKFLIVEKIGVKTATQMAYTWVAIVAQITLSKASLVSFKSNYNFNSFHSFLNFVSRFRKLMMKTRLPVPM